MEIETVNNIVNALSGPAPRLIEGIKFLRAETSMSLLEAKNYLQPYYDGNKTSDDLRQRLCDEFVQNKQELLNMALQEYHRLGMRIDQLEVEIARETVIEESKVHNVFDK